MLRRTIADDVCWQLSVDVDDGKSAARDDIQSGDNYIFFHIFGEVILFDLHNQRPSGFALEMILWSYSVF